MFSVSVATFCCSGNYAHNFDCSIWKCFRSCSLGVSIQKLCSSPLMTILVRFLQLQTILETINAFVSIFPNCTKKLQVFLLRQSEIVILLSIYRYHSSRPETTYSTAARHQIKQQRSGFFVTDRPWAIST